MSKGDTMIKSRTTQLIFQTAYCTLGLVGFVGGLGVYDDVTNLSWDFYVHYTNLSNYFCIAVMLIALIQTARKHDDSYVSAVPALKFIGAVSILITFLVFNILLAGAPDRDPQLNFRIGSLLFHVVLPIMYIADWVLFYERKKVRWFYPFSAILFPFSYMVFILIQAAIMRFDTSILIPGTNTPLIYPYFFMNIEKQGVGGFVMWMFMFLVAVLTIGFLFFGIDRILPSKKNKA